ncbi:MAG TPA: OmpA family protein [Candidatus Kapabacteria bacterium]|nr:OmpA family protein [Candidatus Kapabacteria bacterium]HPP40049.1 OmpA family protein [Candidatus Kapabacteria bacterium]
MRTKWKFFAVALTFIFGGVLFAQTYPYNGQINIGPYLGGNINFHQPSNVNPEVQPATTTQFSTNSNELFLNGGIIANFPISNIISISGRLGYNGFRGELKENNEKMTTNLDYLEITPLVQFHNLFGNLPLYLNLGPEVGIPLNGRFEYQTLAETDIPDKNFRLGIALGAGYTFQIGSSTYLSPEASFRIPFTKVSGSSSWDSYTVPQLRLGMNLTFGLGKKKTPEVVDVPGVELEVGFKEVRYYDKQMNTFPLQRITVEETQYGELFPLLPYVFFAESTARPVGEEAMQGSGRTGEFSIKSLPPDAMVINYQVLDIIGERMKQNTNARITITGTIDNQREKDTRLSSERAEFAKNYILRNFNIDPLRIQTVAGKEPAKPSNPRVADGLAENRRVEITTTNNDILAPITIESERRRISDPDLVEFITYARSNEAIAEWHLEIKQAGKLIKKFDGKGDPQPVKWAITPNELAPSQVPLEYTFSARTTSGASRYATSSVPVEYYSFNRKVSEDRPDRVIYKYSLTLFDFDSPEVSEFDRRILDQHVVPNIKSNSTVQIFGYTDRIGDENYNKRLAQNRADNVRKYLESKVKAKFETFGVGESEIIFDNDSPVGRHLSRTVQIYVSTPKQ